LNQSADQHTDRQGGNRDLKKTAQQQRPLDVGHARHAIVGVAKYSGALYEALSEGGEPLAILKSTGFVGCADGPADLSSGYKKDLTRSLGRKA